MLAFKSKSSWYWYHMNWHYFTHPDTYYSLKAWKSSSRICSIGIHEWHFKLVYTRVSSHSYNWRLSNFGRNPEVAARNCWSSPDSDWPSNNYCHYPRHCTSWLREDHHTLPAPAKYNTIIPPQSGYSLRLPSTFTQSTCNCRNSYPL